MKKDLTGLRHFDSCCRCFSLRLFLLSYCSFYFVFGNVAGLSSLIKVAKGVVCCFEMIKAKAFKFFLGIKHQKLFVFWTCVSK